MRISKRRRAVRCHTPPRTYPASPTRYTPGPRDPCPVALVPATTVPPPGAGVGFMVPSILASILRAIFGESARSPRTVRLGLDVFEDRLVPATASFGNGVLV